MNAIIHRDYDLHAETVMKMSRTEIMFTNFGGLQGISVDSAVQGLAEVRNPLLRQLFYRLDIVEAIGTGLKRIYELYEEEELTPTVKSTGNWFCFSLPNINTTRNPHLSLRRNDGPNLRGGNTRTTRSSTMAACSHPKSLGRLRPYVLSMRRPLPKWASPQIEA